MPLRRNLERRLLLWFLTGATAFALSLFVWLRLDRQEQALSTLTASILRIERAAGFDGFLHNFKNYVLRPKEPSYWMRARADYQRLTNEIAHFEDLSQSANLSFDLGPLRRTVEGYHNNLLLARDARRNGASIQEIDNLVRQNDGPAALNLLKVQDELKSLMAERELLLQAALIATGLAFLIGGAGSIAALVSLTRFATQMETARQAALLKAEKSFTQELSSLVAKLERTNAEQAEFAYAVSHDLKSPTNTAGMLLDALQDELGEDITEDQQELIDDLRTVHRRMARLIEDTLTYTRTLDTEHPKTPVDLNAVLAEVRLALRADIASTGATLTIDKLPTLPADPIQLHRLFLNLLSNALKYHAPDRAPVIHVGAPRFSATLAAIEVADNGIGIAPEHHERIFKLFGRLHGRDAYEGSGLGLPICRRIALSHGGDLTLASTPGIGTTFTVTLSKGPLT